MSWDKDRHRDDHHGWWGGWNRDRWGWWGWWGWWGRH